MLMDKYEKLLSCLAIVLYTVHNIWLFYGNWIFLSLPKTNSDGVSWVDIQPGQD